MQLSALLSHQISWSGVVEVAGELVLKMPHAAAKTFWGTRDRGQRTDLVNGQEEMTDLTSPPASIKTCE